jgi:hypothetical protein
VQLHPTGRIDAAYWLAVIGWMNDRGLPHTDDNVRSAIVGIEQATANSLA